MRKSNLSHPLDNQRETPLAAKRTACCCLGAWWRCKVSLSFYLNHLCILIVRSAPKPTRNKLNSPFNTEKYFHRPIYGIRRGTCSDINVPNEGMNKMISNRQNVDYKLLGISGRVSNILLSLNNCSLFFETTFEVTIVFIFTALFLPSVIVNLLPNASQFDPRIHAMCSLITWFNSMVNPIIYCFLNSRFRDEYKKILRI